LTLYAFSTENWKRPKEEVDALMELIYHYIDEVVIKAIVREGDICVRFIGDKSALSEELRNKCIEAEELAKDRPFVCNIALNYGGRDEIVHAVNSAIHDGYTELSEEILSRYMYSSSPDPDLVIRTGGDFRISNFLLWQIAYSEFIILDTLWPDFGRSDIDRCMAEFGKRKRRFGGLDPEESEAKLI
jgi:undecaprenyl diphosphate synthase